MEDGDGEDVVAGVAGRGTDVDVGALVVSTTLIVIGWGAGAPATGIDATDGTNSPLTRSAPKVTNCVASANTISTCEPAADAELVVQPADGVTDLTVAPPAP